MAKEHCQTQKRGVFIRSPIAAYPPFLFRQGIIQAACCVSLPEQTVNLFAGRQYRYPDSEQIR